MAGNLPRSFRQGRSPFDDLAHHNEVDGTEYWKAREMAPSMGYPRWENFAGVVSRAIDACRNCGQEPSDHFRDATNMIEVGKGAFRPVIDIHLSRYGCYLVAMNGDPRKPDVAAAQQYFALMTRAAEKAVAVPTAIIQAPRPWSERFRETTQDHFCYMTTHHLGYFSVVSATVAQMLMMEEELIRHLLPLRHSDLPDGSIGQHWAKHRWTKGLPPSKFRASLLLPDRGIDAKVLIYPVAELGDFLAWLVTSYLPVQLPEYYRNKPNFRPYGELPSASAADHTCERLTGTPASLAPRLRRQLVAVGGFCPVGKQPPAIEGQQRSLFD